MKKDLIEARKECCERAKQRTEAKEAGKAAEHTGTVTACGGSKPLPALLPPDKEE